MKVEINVALMDGHLFRVNRDEPAQRLKEFLALFRKKFPTREGFQISISVEREERDNYDLNEFLRKMCPGPHYQE